MTESWHKQKMIERLIPKSIAEIARESFCKWFRVRNVESLRDYLVLDFTANGIHVDVYCCDAQSKNTIDCTQKKYVLLSFRDEALLWKRYKKDGVIESLKRAYEGKIVSNSP